MTVLLDTHTVFWWATEPERLSERAAEAISTAEELAVASVTWYELAWLVQHGRIAVSQPLRPWLRDVATDMRTVPTTPEIAATAVGLPGSFPGDPADRVIYATAIELGWDLITRDARLRRYRHDRPIAVW